MQIPVKNRIAKNKLIKNKSMKITKLTTETLTSVLNCNPRIGNISGDSYYNLFSVEIESCCVIVFELEEILIGASFPKPIYTEFESEEVEFVWHTTRDKTWELYFPDQPENDSGRWLTTCITRCYAFPIEGGNKYIITHPMCNDEMHVL